MFSLEFFWNYNLGFTIHDERSSLFCATQYNRFADEQTVESPLTNPAVKHLILKNAAKLVVLCYSWLIQRKQENLKHFCFTTVQHFLNTSLLYLNIVSTRDFVVLLKYNFLKLHFIFVKYKIKFLVVLKFLIEQRYY